MTRPDPARLRQLLDTHRLEILAGEMFCAPVPEAAPSPPPPAPGPNPPAAAPVFLARMAFAAAAAPAVAARPAVALNKNKGSLNKNKNKNKNKLHADGGGVISDTSLIPAFDFRQLHRPAGPDSRKTFFDWERIKLTPPPGPDASMKEALDMLLKQNDVEERRRRLPDIQLESTLDVSSFTRPLYIENMDGFSQTQALFQSIIKICEYVGLIYKDMFNRARPNQIDPRLRPLLPIPAHQAYPSNHSFQCYSIAYAFAVIVPEHVASAELFKIAEKVAVNREWAGLHYHSDTLAGRELARKFLPYLVDACEDTLLAAQAEWR